MSAGSRESFLLDIAASTRVWARLPWVPVVSVLLNLIWGLLPEAAWPVGLAASLWYVGWVGTERICFLRILRAQPDPGGGLWKLTFAFFWRYATLGLIASLPFVALFAVLASGPDYEPARPTTTVLVVSYATTVVIDVALTFVTPALAFTTRRVRHALFLGIQMIRSEWPRSLWYVLVPPLAIVAVFQALAVVGEVSVVAQITSSTVAALLNLLFKGATAAFYLRRHEPYDERNGAAFQPRFPTPASTELPGRPDQT